MERIILSKADIASLSVPLGAFLLLFLAALLFLNRYQPVFAPAPPKATSFDAPSPKPTVKLQQPHSRKPPRRPAKH